MTSERAVESGRRLCLDGAAGLTDRQELAGEPFSTGVGLFAHATGAEAAGDSALGSS